MQQINSQTYHISGSQEHFGDGQHWDAEQTKWRICNEKGPVSSAELEARTSD